MRNPPICMTAIFSQMAPHVHPDPISISVFEMLCGSLKRPSETDHKAPCLPHPSTERRVTENRLPSSKPRVAHSSAPKTIAHKHDTTRPVADPSCRCTRKSQHSLHYRLLDKHECRRWQNPPHRAWSN